MKKHYYIISFIIMLLVSIIGITYSYENNSIDSIKFDLIGPSTLYIDVNTEYTEYGIKATYLSKDISDQVIIDKSNLDMTKLGEYLIKYSINFDNITEYVYRKVIVIDKTSPVITLTGGNDIKILINGKYYEQGYTVTDNYDTNLEDLVTTSGQVDTTKEGTYIIEYSVTDSSGNSTKTKRKVNVVAPVISLDDNSYGKIYSQNFNPTSYSNSITKNSFTKNGIYYEGYVSNPSNIYKIKLKSISSNLEYTYNMTVNNNNYFLGELDLTYVSNGEYELYIIGNQEERLLNKLDILSKIVRAKVGNKLITVKYTNDAISILVSKFNYEYDIVIDPGHGGSDIGASNGIIDEKDLNLKISKYEACRYRSMGYSVYLIRDDDTYGEMLGNNTLDILDRRALTIGYYGSVSKIAYSNHHNGSTRLGDYGFEILVGNQNTKSDLVLELSLYNKFKKLYNINDSALRIYSRDYETGISYDKTNGNVYNSTNYYAVIRIPYELYNVKNVIYEPIYLTNVSDFNWYYVNNNWIKVSELKIQEYVNLLGGVYDIDNSKCL